MTKTNERISKTRERMSVTSETNKVNDFLDDQLLLRRAFGHFPSGIAALAVDYHGPQALIASSFMVGVSLDPCLVAVAIQKSSKTWSLIRKAPTIGVSIFSNGQGSLIRQLAGKDRAKRFTEVAAEVNESGAIYIEDAAMWLETKLYDENLAGDHWMALLEVTRLGFDENTDPLVWHGSRFRELTREAAFDV